MLHKFAHLSYTVVYDAKFLSYSDVLRAMLVVTFDAFPYELIPTFAGFRSHVLDIFFSIGVDRGIYSLNFQYSIFFVGYRPSEHRSDRVYTNESTCLLHDCLD